MQICIDLSNINKTSNCTNLCLPPTYLLPISHSFPSKEGSIAAGSHTAFTRESALFIIDAHEYLLNEKKVNVFKKLLMWKHSAFYFIKPLVSITSNKISDSNLLNIRRGLLAHLIVRSRGRIGWSKGSAM